jgi:hypothetical protein
MRRRHLLTAPAFPLTLTPPHTTPHPIHHLSIHCAGGGSLVEAFGQAALAFWAHLVDPRSIVVPTEEDAPAGTGTRLISASGKDVIDLLFNFLDACLYAYGSDYFLAGRVRVLRFDAPALPLKDVYGGAAGAGTGAEDAPTGSMMHIVAQWCVCA